MRMVHCKVAMCVAHKATSSSTMVEELSAMRMVWPVDGACGGSDADQAPRLSTLTDIVNTPTSSTVTTGETTGKYRPTFALLKDSADPSSGDGSSYTYTVIAR